LTDYESQSGYFDGCLRVWLKQMVHRSLNRGSDIDKRKLEHAYMLPSATDYTVSCIAERPRPRPDPTAYVTFDSL
jgi:hypothetical protein